MVFKFINLQMPWLVRGIACKFCIRQNITVHTSDFSVNNVIYPSLHLFSIFRETQSIIKVQKPDATFGEISKIVASMWDGLGDHEKTVRDKKS